MALNYLFLWRLFFLAVTSVPIVFVLVFLLLLTLLACHLIIIIIVPKHQVILTEPVKDTNVSLQWIPLNCIYLLHVYYCLHIILKSKTAEYSCYCIFLLFAYFFEQIDYVINIYYIIITMESMTFTFDQSSLFSNLSEVGPKQTVLWGFIKIGFIDW